MYCMEKGCQEVHCGRKSEFWERKFPGLLPWGLEKKCRAIKRLLRLKFPTSRSRANVIECEIALQSPICPIDWIQQAIFGSLLCKHYISIISSISTVWIWLIRFDPYLQTRRWLINYNLSIFWSPACVPLIFNKHWLYIKHCAGHYGEFMCV